MVNVCMVDFITDELFERTVEPGLGAELEGMDDEQARTFSTLLMAVSFPFKTELIQVSHKSSSSISKVKMNTAVIIGEWQCSGVSGGHG